MPRTAAWLFCILLPRLLGVTKSDMARPLKLEILARRSIQSAQRSVPRFHPLSLSLSLSLFLRPSLSIRFETSFKKKQGPRITILGSKKRASFSAHRYSTYLFGRSPRGRPVAYLRPDKLLSTDHLGHATKIGTALAVP